MKKLMVTAALIAGLSGLGYAQDNVQSGERVRPRGERPGREHVQRTPEQRAQASADMLEKRLSLTSDQKAKVYALNLERARQMEKIMKSEREHRKEQMEKQRSFMKDSDEKLTKILNDEQKKSYEEMKKQGRERMKARRPGPPARKTK